MTETHAILQRLRDLAVQGANDSNNDKARANIATEATSLVSELDRIAESTNFNGRKLLDGGAAANGGTAPAAYNLNFQVGADGDAASAITVNLSSANVSSVADALTVRQYDTATGAWEAAGAEVDFSTHAGAQASITAIDAQIESVSTARAELGAYQNRFEHTIKNINVAVE
ncbi:flagellin, partial [Populibacterium corticicola]